MSLAKAIETGDLTQLPSRRDEDWRWTDLRGLLRALPPASPEAQIAPGGPFEAAGGEELSVVNGRVAGAAGLIVEGERLVRLRFVSTALGSHAAKVKIEIKPGASLHLLESYEAQADGAVASAEVDIVLGEGARLERVVLVQDGPESVTVSQARIFLAAGAEMGQTVLTSGGRRQRIETHVAHPGIHATIRMDGAYLLRDQRHADLTTVVTHGGLDGTTSQLTKGVVHDQARGVFQGRIVVEHGADKTDARMGHHALILSDKAEIDAKPELLIFADDVQCAHGNTIGALDENALFYARQRGIPLDEAKALLTAAFVGEVVDRIAYEPAREVAAAWVAAQLGRAG
ncbi:Fe-S cluster assembly protein SufD [Caulobacter mirabilis]|uniref:Fe-S cluster assembly protein SufD n=1 Tax=Caulobacter mirabilis TaxID=69666 RepID=A0A2D2AYU6_9CAUL|nr:Fe-S cluster assembly protein SufD [Caulobacter mirabilis]ATQ43173.1 Fe-S cluster assembly protein SufD [Caulobacter mirabilis]